VYAQILRPPVLTQSSWSISWPDEAISIRLDTVISNFSQSIPPLPVAQAIDTNSSIERLKLARNTYADRYITAKTRIKQKENIQWRLSNAKIVQSSLELIAKFIQMGYPWPDGTTEEELLQFKKTIRIFPCCEFFSWFDHYKSMGGGIVDVNYHKDGPNFNSITIFKESAEVGKFYCRRTEVIKRELQDREQLAKKLTTLITKAFNVVKVLEDRNKELSATNYQSLAVDYKKKIDEIGLIVQTRINKESDKVKKILETIDEKAVQIEKLENQLAENKRRISTLNYSYKHLREGLKSLENDRDNLDEGLEKAYDELYQKKKELASKTKDYQFADLREKLPTGEVLKIKELNTQILELEVKIRELRVKKTKIRSSINTAHEEMYRNRSSIHTLNAVINDSEIDISKKKVEFADFQSTQRLEIDRLERNLVESKAFSNHPIYRYFVDEALEDMKRKQLEDLLKKRKT
jgi:hypothetical protein